MRTNFMMCDIDKIEMIVFSPTRGPTQQSIHLKYGNDMISHVKKVNNRGVIFDQRWNYRVMWMGFVIPKFEKYFASKSLDKQHCKTHIHVFVTSR